MSLVIRANQVIDGCGGQPLKDAVVILEGERICAIGRAGEVVVPQGTPVIQAQTVMPGLIDAHVHLNGCGEPNMELRRLKESVGLSAFRSYAHAKKSLEAGFTSLRDAGGREFVDVALRQSIAEGWVTGPRLKVCGQGICTTGSHGDGYIAPDISTTDGTSFFGLMIANSPEEVRRAARIQVKNGVDVVKIVATGGVLSHGDEVCAPQMTLEEMKAAFQVARWTGKRTAAHAHGGEGLKMAILAGVNSIEHGTFLTDEVVELMVERDVYLVPTLTALHCILQHGVEAGIPDYAVEKAKQAQEVAFRSFELALWTGVKIAMGTDAATPFNRHGDNAQELSLMVQGGMNPMGAIVAATRTGAEVLGVADLVGTVETGKLADLLIVSGDPLEDIRILADREKIELVIKDGQIVADRRQGKRDDPSS
jgi:imidazolonepropionase-like amidohydrolase